MRKIFTLMAAGLMAICATAQSRWTSTFDVTKKNVFGTVTYLDGRVESFDKIEVPTATTKSLRATTSDGQEIEIPSQDINYITLSHVKAPEKSINLYWVMLDERIATSIVTHRWCLKTRDLVWAESFAGYDRYGFDRRNGNFITIMNGTNFAAPALPTHLLRHRQKQGAYWWIFTKKYRMYIYEDFPELQKKAEKLKMKEFMEFSERMQELDEAYTQKYLQ